MHRHPDHKKQPTHDPAAPVLSFHGAAQGVTGSCYLLEAAGLSILVDCGLYQGSHAIIDENEKPFGFDAAAIDYVLLTHAHLDHCGRLPLLVKNGFRGEIIATSATRELTRLILLDCAHLEEEDAKRARKRPLRRGQLPPEPLYTIADALWSCDRFGRTAEYGVRFALADGIGVPVTPFGAGSSLEGHVIPVDRGISLDVSRMNRILDISPADLTATVEPGVTRSELERAAAGHGLFFPVDPGADATLGGMAATDAAGTTTVRYGKMRANVLALEAVLASGRVVRAGSRAPKSSAGYDLLGLLIGSEGTLAVITELTLRLRGIPEASVVLRLAFPDLEAACRAAATIVAAGAGVTRAELLDAWTIESINAYSGTNLPAGPSLFVEASGSEGAVASDLELVREVAAAEGATDVVAERDPTARSRLWAARHASAYASGAAVPGKKHRPTDICVPLSELAAAVSFARAEVERRGLTAGVVGHAGDGNVHLSLHVDPDDADEVRSSDELIELIVADALARGGTCTGEHGIGLGKVHALEQEHGDLITLMQGVKRLFDPNGIMNPGKVLPPLDVCGD
jgi:D-lactate dehydrogenase (cytochrome)